MLSGMPLVAPHDRLEAELSVLFVCAQLPQFLEDIRSASQPITVDDDDDDEDEGAKKPAAVSVLPPRVTGAKLGPPGHQQQQGDAVEGEEEDAVRTVGPSASGASLTAGSLAVSEAVEAEAMEEAGDGGGDGNGQAEVRGVEEGPPPVGVLPDAEDEGQPPLKKTKSVVSVGEGGPLSAVSRGDESTGKFFA
jgi:hypothetical protein